MKKKNSPLFWTIFTTGRIVFDSFEIRSIELNRFFFISGINKKWNELSIQNDFQFNFNLNINTSIEHFNQLRLIKPGRKYNSNRKENAKLRCWHSIHLNGMINSSVNLKSKWTKNAYFFYSLDKMVENKAEKEDDEKHVKINWWIP